MLEAEPEALAQAIITHTQWARHNVTLICGPPCSGKSTLARLLYRKVIELERYKHADLRHNLRAYGRDVATLGRQPSACAAVIRGAPTAAEREHQEQACKPRQTVILLTPAALCHARIDERAEIEGIARWSTPAAQHAEVNRWWRLYDGPQG
jgi:thymidylate kinase